MNPGPAPRPPTDRPKVSLTPQVYNQSGNSNLSSFPGATPIGSSTSSFQSGSSNGDMTVVKDGFAKIKEENGGILKAFWTERFLVLREKQLDFLKNNQSNKTLATIPLREVTHITRSDTYTFSIELTREGGKVWILKFESDNEVYNWIDSIYDRVPSMGGVSHPTGFSHRVHVGFDPVTGGFVGLPVEWERLLKGSALTKDDMAKNPQAVMEVLQFYTDKLAVRAEDPKMYSSLTPTPTIEAGREKQLGYSAGNGVAPPRPQHPNYGRQDSYSSAGGSRSPATTPGSGYNSSRDASADRFGGPKRADTAPVSSLDPRAEEERRKKAEDQKRRMDAERRRMDEEQERKRRQQEQADREYNDSLPKTKVPLAKQELGGYGGADSNSSPSSASRYNPSRPAPPAPGKAGASSSPGGTSIPIRNLQAQRPAPGPPGSQNGKQIYNRTTGQTAANTARQVPPMAPRTVSLRLRVPSNRSMSPLSPPVVHRPPPLLPPKTRSSRPRWRSPRRTPWPTPRRPRRCG